MKRPTPEKPFEPLYAAKREYEELRRGLSRALAQWTAGAAEFSAIFPAIEAFEDSHRKLIETIYEQGNAQSPEAAQIAPPATALVPAKKKAIKQTAR
ncbi:MAG: hypothetical protein ACR2GP_16375 [Burkholderiaceae bacterium]